MEKKHAFILRIAGINISIHTDFDAIRKRMEGYIVEDSPADLTVEIDDSTRKDVLERLKASKGDTLPVSEEYAEFIALHTDIATGLLRYDILLMHGSALAMDNEGYLFTAPSGTGKSTHTRLWRECFGDRVTMINDDKPMLIFKEDRIMVCGTPWNGKHGIGNNLMVPLKAIVLLSRGETNRIEEVRPVSVIDLLYRQVLRPEDPEKAAIVLKLLARICAQVKTYRLECTMDPEAALVAYEGITQS